MLFDYLVFRKMCTEADSKRDEGLTTPDCIERFDNIAYGADTETQVLDLYRPKEYSGKLPAIVSFHGGGWVYGNKEVYQFYCMDLARRGFAVVNYTYRLAPEFRHPAALEDTNAVFGWLMDNAGRYDIDIGNIFAVGDSAGACGIALYSCIVTDPAYAANYDFSPPAGLKIKALALNCGVYDTSDPEKVGLLRYYLPEGDFPEKLGVMDVSRNVSAGFPPCCIMTANADPLSAEAEILMKSLDKAGVVHRYKQYGDDAAPLGHVFHCDVKSEAAARANDDECAFFREYIE